MPRLWTLLPLSFLLLPSCGPSTGPGKAKPKTDASFAPSTGAAGIAAFHQAASEQGGGGQIIKAGGNNPLQMAQVEDKDILWTDPDNPNAEIPNLDALLKEAAKNHGPWESSEAIAVRESKSTGKPLLIWFTNSSADIVNKPIAEMFNRDDFEKWAKENVIRLRVDQTPIGATMPETDARKIYERKLIDRYKVMGYPTLIIVSPSGEVVARYVGFKNGQADYKWGQLRQGTKIAVDNYQKTRTELMKKGYRDWSDGKGRSVFARLAAYRDGELLLIEPDGSRAKTNEKRLSEGDRAWIQAEKEKRGIQ